MALATNIVDLIRDEIGRDSDFADDIPHDPATQLDSLENIYTNQDRGNFDILRTALICWRRRLHSYQKNAFDASQEGSQVFRSQRVRYFERRIKELEILIEDTGKQRNLEVVSPSTPEASAEFS